MPEMIGPPGASARVFGKMREFGWVQAWAVYAREIAERFKTKLRPSRHVDRMRLELSCLFFVLGYLLSDQLDDFLRGSPTHDH